MYCNRCTHSQKDDTDAVLYNNTRKLYQIEKKKLILKKDEKPTVLKVSAKDLSMIFENLISNAIKYTKEGGHITFSTSADNQNLTLSIQDTGIGMTKEQLKHIFDSFYQVQSGVNGTGIGLALVQAFTDLHHGHVTVESTPGEGSTFQVTIPCKQDGPLTEIDDNAVNNDRKIYAMEEEPVSLSEEPSKTDQITDPDETIEQRQSKIRINLKR